MNDIVVMMQKPLESFAEELNNLKQKLAANYTNALKDEMNRMNIPYVCVVGYTPYFNDGDECKFSAYDVDPTDECHFDEELAIIYGDNVPEYNYTTWKGINKAISASREIFQIAFGDHQTHLFVLKDGVFHEFHQEYDHH